MKTEVIDGPAQKDTRFPGLFKSGINGTVVLMTSESTGFVISRPDGSDGDPVGFYSSEWIMSLFDRLPSGTKVILTQE